LNGLALALQIGFLRMTDRTLNSVELIQPAVLDHLGRQLGCPPPRIASIRAFYRRRRRTLFEHHAAALHLLGRSELTLHAERGLVAYLRREAAAVFDPAEPMARARAWLVNYAERHRAGLRVGTSITEGAANHLVNRRMNKSQQMRWSRRGADLLLQVRCAAYNGRITPDLAQSMSGPRGSSAAIGDGVALVFSCRRERKPLEARDSLRAAHRTCRGDAGGERGCARAAA
jgi:hypothetical protein